MSDLAIRFTVLEMKHLSRRTLQIEPYLSVKRTTVMKIVEKNLHTVGSNGGYRLIN